MFDKRLMEVCPESKKYIIGNIVLQWLELFLNAVMIITIARFIAQIYERNWGPSDLAVPIAIIMGTILIRFFTTRYAIRMSYLASKTVKKKMREMIYGKLLKLGLSYREQVSTAELVQESVEGVDQLESYFGQYVPQFFYAFLAPVTLFFLFGFGGSWGTAAVLLVCVPLIPGAIMMVQKIAKKLLSKYWGQYAQLGSTFLENLQGMTTLKIYQVDAFKNEQMNEESEHFRQVTMKVLTMQLNSIIIMDLFAYGGAGLGILLATRAFVQGRLELANCIFMILLSAEFFLPMRRLGSYFHVAMNGMAASDKIFKFLALEEPKAKQEMLDSEKLEIVLQDVRFSYDGEREILHGVSLRIPRKSFIGIVGESGCGKSTIASLLMGRETAGSGSVTIGGRELGQVREESLMKTVVYISHNSVFFKGTVRDNLLLGNPDASDEALWKVLEDCQLAGFLQTEQGLDTELLENAGNLSGGQKQRLALARAILHDAAVYLFDEATSNIDVESEEAILQQIHRLAERKTILMISHRLANVADADCIYVMENGSIMEQGRHEELLKKDGVYATLWRTQQELEQFGRG
ncbi:MAG: ABC transporter ATP-binding protein/permease [Lachnospiraceae bacterium]|nr:ABC transporter ATP-binding protein/permease [Lachnospiraceae bacterium]